jgi:hypothetical protein
MKKIVLSLLLILSLYSCTVTTIRQDQEMLQHKYPGAIVYSIHEDDFIVVDKCDVYDIRVGSSGNITSTIKIN